MNSPFYLPPPAAPDLLLEVSSETPLAKLLPVLLRSLKTSGSYLHQHTLGSHAIELSLEVHRHAVDDLYTTLVATGLLLSRPAHTALAALCTADRHPVGPRPRGTIVIHLVIEMLTSSRTRGCAPTRTASA